MSAKATKVIGYPGQPGKIKIPEGFELWEFERFNLVGNLNFVGYPGASGSNVFEFQNNNLGAYSPGDIQIWYLKTVANEASRAWSAAGSNPRLSCRVWAGSQWTNSFDVSNEDNYIQSSDCDISNQNRAYAEVKGIYYTSYKANGINPLSQLRAQFLDPPGSRNICFNGSKTRARILFRSSMLEQISSNTNFIKRII